MVVILCYLVAIVEMLKLCESSVFTFLEKEKKVNEKRKKKQVSSESIA